MNFRSIFTTSLCYVCLFSGIVGQELHPGHPLHHDPDLQHESSIRVNLAWDSIYVLEGRNALDQGSLASLGGEWTTPHSDNEFILSTWYAEGVSTDYREFQLGAAYAFSFDSVDATFGYTWLDWDADDVTDHELNFEIGTDALGLVDLTAIAVYSFGASGTFFQLIASRDFPRNHMVFTPYVLLGLNDGYVPDEHKGLNNLQFGLEFTTSLSEKFELGGYLAYTLGLKEKPGETLENMFWGGISLGWSN
jgi:hypothetical protein